MLAARYLAGLDARALESFPGLFEVTDPRRRNSYRYVSTYADGNRQKDRFFAFLAQHGQAEAREVWHLHHVVEGHHFADVDFEGRIEKMYEDELPCVFIYKDEHDAYTRQARLRGTTEMYREPIARKKSDRSRLAHAAAVAARTDPALRAKLRTRVERLRGYYRDLHEGDEFMQKLADNVLIAIQERLGL